MRVAERGQLLWPRGRWGGEAEARTREPTLAGQRGGEGLEPAGPTSLAEGNDQDGRGNGDQEQRRWQRLAYEHQRHGRLGFLRGG